MNMRPLIALAATAVFAAASADPSAPALKASAAVVAAPAGGYDDDTPATQEELISAGRRKFNDPWSLRNDIEGVWGLGPTFNEKSCPACHQNASRSAAPADGAEAVSGMVIRLSLPGRTSEGAPKPHPHYGDQLQNRSISPSVPREGRAFIHYEPVTVAMADGETVTLRRPRVEFRDLQFGPLAPEVMVSARTAPPLFGLGLLEAVSEASILERAARQTELGLRGKPNYVWDAASGRLALGRFGWKANQPSVQQQVAAALLNDIGATSSLFPIDNCPPVQTACRSHPTTTDCGGGAGGCTGTLLPEVLPSRLATITLYMQALRPAPRSPGNAASLQHGRALFDAALCSICHVAQLRTATSASIAANADAVVEAYTDLLLHDMGEELADGRPDFLADGRQWRTAPLWGLGLNQAQIGHQDLLHDGRARGVGEAILWHGGEAAPAREAYKRMSRQERDLLVGYVNGL